MRIPHRCAPVALTLVLCLISSSCLWTHRVILRGGKRVVAGALPVLKTSTLEDLEKRIANLYNAIKSFQATVEMTPSVGSVYKGEITEGSGLIKDVHSYILFRKPDWIRIIGKLRWSAPPNSTWCPLPMHSGSTSLEEPFRRRGQQRPYRFKERFENLRPEHFLSAMMIRPMAPGENPDSGGPVPTRTTPCT